MKKMFRSGAMSLKKVLCLAVVGVMCFGMMACGKSKTPNYYEEVLNGTKDMPFTDVMLSDTQEQMLEKMKDYVNSSPLEGAIFVYKNMSYQGRLGQLVIHVSTETGLVDDIMWKIEDGSTKDFYDWAAASEASFGKPNAEESVDDPDMKLYFYEIDGMKEYISLYYSETGGTSKLYISRKYSNN